MNEEESVNIDSENDFFLAEYYLKKIYSTLVLLRNSSISEFIQSNAEIPS